MSAQDLPTPLPVIEWREVYEGTISEKRGARIVSRWLGVPPPGHPEQTWTCRLGDGSFLQYVAEKHIAREVFWECAKCKGEGLIRFRNPRTASTPEDAEDCDSCGGSGGAWVRQPGKTG